MKKKIQKPLTYEEISRLWLDTNPATDTIDFDMCVDNEVYNTPEIGTKTTVLPLLDMPENATVQPYVSTPTPLSNEGIVIDKAVVNQMNHYYAAPRPVSPYDAYEQEKPLFSYAQKMVIRKTVSYSITGSVVAISVGGVVVLVSEIVGMIAPSVAILSAGLMTLAEGVIWVGGIGIFLWVALRLLLSKDPSGPRREYRQHNGNYTEQNRNATININIGGNQSFSGTTTKGFNE